MEPQYLAMTPFLDLVFPPKCAICGMLGRAPVCTACFSHFVTQDPRRYRTEKPLDYAAALFDYTGHAARAVQRLKYERVTSLVDWMADLMLRGAKERDLLRVDAILPVPIHWSRESLRGFNQAKLLCEKLPSALVRNQILRRSKATRPQVGLSPAERARNIEGAFEVGDLSGLTSFLLVDDVLTSGGTASECAAALKRAGAVDVGIYCFAADARWRGY